MPHIRTALSSTASVPDLRATVQGKVVTIFLDSGAEVNLIKEDTIRTLDQGTFKWLEGELMIINSVSNDPVQVLGAVAVELQLGISKLFIHAYVVKGSGVNYPADLLIGRPTMVKEQIRPVFHENVVFVRDRLLPLHERVRPGIVGALTPAVQDTARDYYFQVECVARTCSNTTLYSNTLTKVELQLDLRQLTELGYDVNSRGFSVTCLTNPESVTFPEVMLEGELHETVSGKLVTYVANRSPAPIHLKRGTSFLSVQLLKGPIQEQELQQVQVSSIMQSQVRSLAQNQQEGNSKQPEPITSDMLSSVALRKDVESMVQLLTEYRDTVALSGEPLGRTDVLDHHITLYPGVSPIYVPAYRLPHSQREVADKLVQDMLRQGVVEPSKSPWNFPLILVPKKDGTWHPVIDYRRLNAVTQPDRFPIPVLSDLLHSLGKNKVFSTIDLLSGFWQIPLREESRELTAFSTPTGHYQFVVTPFGLHSSPITFSRLMQMVFSDLIGKEVLVYMDDIIVISQDVPTHFERLRHVLDRLRSANLKLKLSKCVFLQTTIKYLGHTVTEHGISPLTDKVEAVYNFPVPKNVEEIRSFLGLVGFYRSFIKDFSRIAAPLNRLLSKSVPFEWGKEQQDAYTSLRDRLTDAPILAFPDFTQPFTLYTDASDYAVGAALMQQHGTQLHPVAYFSKQLNKAQRNYSVTEKEALAVVLALKHFRTYIFGYPVTVFTDHQPLLGIFKGTQYQGRLARWSLLVQEYNPDFKYVPGKANVVADGLSRLVASISTFPTIDSEDLKTQQETDPLWGTVVSYLSGRSAHLKLKLPVPVRELFLNEKGVLSRDVLLGLPARRVT